MLQIQKMIWMIAIVQLQVNNTFFADIQSTYLLSYILGPTPADIGVKKERKQSVYAKINPEERQPPNVDLDNEEALYFSSEETTVQPDWRKTPQWDVTYKQQVTPSDVFLQVRYYFFCYIFLY